MKGTLWDDTAGKSLLTPSSANESTLSAFTERHQSVVVNCTRRPQAPVPRADLVPYISRKRTRESMCTNEDKSRNYRGSDPTHLNQTHQQLTAALDEKSETSLSELEVLGRMQSKDASNTVTSSFPVIHDNSRTADPLGETGPTQEATPFARRHQSRSHQKQFNLMTEQRMQNTTLQGSSDSTMSHTFVPGGSTTNFSSAFSPRDMRMQHQTQNAMLLHGYTSSKK